MCFAWSLSTLLAKMDVVIPNRKVTGIPCHTRLKRSRRVFHFVNNLCQDVSLDFDPEIREPWHETRISEGDTDNTREIQGERWGKGKGCFRFVDRSCLVLKKSIFVDCLHLASFGGCGKVAPPSPLTHTSSCQKRTGWHRGKGRPRKRNRNIISVKNEKQFVKMRVRSSWINKAWFS